MREESFESGSIVDQLVLLFCLYMLVGLDQQADQPWHVTVLPKVMGWMKEDTLVHSTFRQHI